MSVCALVAAADFNTEAFEAMYEEDIFDAVIAIDAGYSHLLAIDVVPDLVIGDFDSLGYFPKGIRTSRFSAHKDKSDMELALERVKSRRYDAVVVFGATGGRLDHTIANLQLFTKFSQLGISVTVIDKQNEIVFVTGPDVFESEAKPSGTVSVFAMNDTAEGFFERGLKWELDDATLTNKTSLGLSNELIGEPVLIGVESGTIMIFMPL